MRDAFTGDCSSSSRAAGAASGHACRLRCRRRRDAPVPCRAARRSSRRFARSARRGSLSMAGRRRQRRGEEVDGRRRCLRARPSCASARAGGHRRAVQGAPLRRERGHATPVRAAGFFSRGATSGKEKFTIYWREGKSGPDNVLLDPNAWSTDGSVSLGVWVVSHDGKRVAYTVKSNNSDEATLHVMEVATGKKSDVDVIEGAKYAWPSWTPSGNGFYYTWLPPSGQRPHGRPSGLRRGPLPQARRRSEERSSRARANRRPEDVRQRDGSPRRALARRHRSSTAGRARTFISRTSTSRSPHGSRSSSATTRATT